MEQPDSKARRGGRRIRTLVVDDSAPALRTICAFLETLGNIEVVGTAGDGCQALERAETLQPDLVLMDLQMPGLSGATATERLRERFSHMVIIIVTVHEGGDVRRLCRDAGAHGFISKDRLGDELPSLIRRIFYPHPS